MFEEIISKIEQYDSIVLFGHLNPDGDCYGSQIALRAILKKQYPHKQVYAVGSGLPNFFHLLGKMDQVSIETIQNSLAVILDSNDLSRIEDKRVFSALSYAKIDHHIDTHSFKEGPEVINANATSTSELIYDFAKENGFVIPVIAAKALYLGLLTDTGRFQYAKDFVKLFDMLKNLITLGVEPIKITAILNITQEKALQIRQFIYSRYHIDKEGIIYVLASKKEREALGVSSASVVANTSLISHVKDYPIWFIASETDNGGMQVEMRSNAVNIHSVALAFGGGGHAFAAGFTINKYSQENIKKLLDLLKQALKEKRE